MVKIDNFIGTATPQDAARMVGLGSARISSCKSSLFDLDREFRAGRQPDFSIELTFSALDAAIASNKGPSCAGAHSVVGKLKMNVSGWDGHDPFRECSAVMMRGNAGAPVSYY